MTRNGRWDPFAVLGLPASPSLSDDQVRAAWRQIAATTHPDRPGGGDPARYAAASRAYAELRTPWSRAEAYADLLAGRPGTEPPAPPPPPAAGHLPTLPPAWQPAHWPARARRGRPLRLALRTAIAAAAAAAAFTIAGTTPPGPAVAVGAALWLILTGRGDLAPPPGH